MGDNAHLMKEEVEIKLSPPESARRAFLRHPLLQQADKLPTRKLLNIYFDTPDLALHRKGIDPGLQPWVEDATADLAERLGVVTDAISTIAAVLVTWPDSSLGCPQPGMEYLQVLTDGAVIELEAEGAVYRYHAGEGSGPFLCGTPITSAPAPAG